MATSALAKEPVTVVTVPAGEAVIGTTMAGLKTQLAGSRARPGWYKDENPQRKTKVDSFLIDIIEVSNARYQSSHPDHSYPDNLKDHPVVNVTWDEADTFCSDAGGRLPTEVEWEYAARGPKGFVYPWGDSLQHSNAVFLGSGRSGGGLKVGTYELETDTSNQLGGTEPVGLRERGKSPFGIHDMAGNAWEWVAGWYDEAKGLRSLKGGSWLTPAASIRSAARLGDDAGRRFNDYGFRCAYDIK